MSFSSSPSSESRQQREEESAWAPRRGGNDHPSSRRSRSSSVGSRSNSPPHSPFLSTSPSASSSSPWSTGPPAGLRSPPPPSSSSYDVAPSPSSSPNLKPSSTNSRLYSMPSSSSYHHNHHPGSSKSYGNHFHRRHPSSFSSFRPSYVPSSSPSSKPSSAAAPPSRLSSLPPEVVSEQMKEPVLYFSDAELEAARIPPNQPPWMTGELFNITPWWGGGAFPPEAENDRSLLQKMAFAVIERRAAVHRAVRHVDRGNRKQMAELGASPCPCRDYYIVWEYEPRHVIDENEKIAAERMEAASSTNWQKGGRGEEGEGDEGAAVPTRSGVYRREDRENSRPFRNMTLLRRPSYVQEKDSTAAVPEVNVEIERQSEEDNLPPPIEPLHLTPAAAVAAAAKAEVPFGGGATKEEGGGGEEKKEEAKMMETEVRGEVVTPSPPVTAMKPTYSKKSRPKAKRVLQVKQQQQQQSPKGTTTITAEEEGGGEATMVQPIAELVPPTSAKKAQGVGGVSVEGEKEKAEEEESAPQQPRNKTPERSFASILTSGVMRKKEGGEEQGGGAFHPVSKPAAEEGEEETALASIGRAEHKVAFVEEPVVVSEPSSSSVEAAGGEGEGQMRGEKAEGGKGGEGEGKKGKLPKLQIPKEEGHEEGEGEERRTTRIAAQPSPRMFTKSPRKSPGSASAFKWLPKSPKSLSAAATATFASVAVVDDEVKGEEKKKEEVDERGGEKQVGEEEGGVGIGCEKERIPSSDGQKEGIAAATATAAESSSSPTPAAGTTVKKGKKKKKGKNQGEGGEGGGA